MRIFRGYYIHMNEHTKVLEKAAGKMELKDNFIVVQNIFENSLLI